jgi:carbohydrate kinase (thermoresistant glucokinase family)
MVPSIIYIMGVSGCGKTTIGKSLSVKTGLPFFDADDFHSHRNIEKMKAGIPLTDEDREDFLITINQVARTQMIMTGAIIACSALKKKYRTVLSDGISIPLFWVFLEGSYELILERLQTRPNHFMPPALLSSQFETLEPPEECIRIDISEKPDTIVETILAQLKN